MLLAHCLCIPSTYWGPIPLPQSDPIYLARGLSDCYVSTYGLVISVFVFLWGALCILFFVKVLTLKSGEWMFFKLFETLKFPINTHNILRVHSTRSGVKSINFVFELMSHSLATVMLWHFLGLSSRIADTDRLQQLPLSLCGYMAYKVEKHRTDMQHYAAFCLHPNWVNAKASHCIIGGVTMMSFDPKTTTTLPPRFVCNWLEISIRIFVDNSSL